MRKLKALYKRYTIFNRVLRNHWQTVDELRQIITEVYPDATRSDYPYYEIRSYMSAVLRTLDEFRELR